MTTYPLQKYFVCTKIISPGMKFNHDKVQNNSKVHHRKILKKLTHLVLFLYIKNSYSTPRVFFIK